MHVVPDSEVVQHYPSGTWSGGYQHTQDDEIQLGTMCGILQECYRTIPEEDKASAVVYGIEDLKVTYKWRLTREQVLNRRFEELEAELAKGVASGIGQEDLDKLIVGVEQIGTLYEDDILIYPTQENPDQSKPQGVPLKDFMEFMNTLAKKIPHDPVSMAEIRGNVTGWLKVRVNYRNSLDALEKLEKRRQYMIDQLKQAKARGGLNKDEVKFLIDTNKNA